MDIRIQRYEPKDASSWNEFVSSSRNGTFLHNRGFMEYHAERFVDHSLLIKTGLGKLTAVLPAELDGTLLRSHGGLTYGGLLTGKDMTAENVLAIFKELGPWLRSQGFRALQYKAVPHIFHRVPAEEDLYALYQAGARLELTHLASVLDLAADCSFSKSKRQGARRAEKAGFSVFEVIDYAPFWTMLEHRLLNAHNALPTHSLPEIMRLRSDFPDYIRLFVAGQTANQPEAGVVVFDCGVTVHAQYMASTDAGRRNGGLDLVLMHLLSAVFRNRRYFSFGTSTENGGKYLNVGLARQKEMFGARGVVFPQYLWEL